ncbi:MAG: LPS export ABC transporter periplasmic protein LptC [Rickettsiales bacterium]
MERDDSHTPGLSANWAVREVDQLFSRFRRYTRFVLFSKWFLGVFAIALMVSLIAWPLLSKNETGIRLSFTDAKTTGANTIASPAMSSPIYRSIGEHGQQFKVAGIKATQATPSLVVLEAVDGQMLQQNGSWMQLNAKRADYFQDKRMVELSGDVTLINSQGYAFVSEHATVNTQTMDMQGESPVSGTGPLGNLLASGFKITDNGAHIVFTRGPKSPVKLEIERTGNPQRKR